jgi:hypothetical protein
MEFDPNPGINLPTRYYTIHLLSTPLLSSLGDVDPPYILTQQWSSSYIDSGTTDVRGTNRVMNPPHYTGRPIM